MQPRDPVAVLQEILDMLEAVYKPAELSVIRNLIAAAAFIAPEARASEMWKRGSATLAVLDARMRADEPDLWDMVRLTWNPLYRE
jgi:hypothetical protein